MCAVLPLEGENFSYVRLNFSIQIRRRALIDTSANALPESLFNDLNLTNPKSLTLEKPFFNSVRMASDQKVRWTNKQKCHFRSDLTISMIIFYSYRL